MNQANKSMSWDTPLAGTTWAWLAGSAHRCQVMANAPARYSSGTSQSAGRPGSRRKPQPQPRGRSVSDDTACAGRRTELSLTAAPRWMRCVARQPRAARRCSRPADIRMRVSSHTAATPSFQVIFLPSSRLRAR